MTATAPAATRRPRIQMTAEEANRLADLAVSVEERMPEVSSLLMQELDRAQTLPEAKIGADVVRMESHVTYSDEASGQHRTVQLVYPGQANIEEGRISILTPIGAALIGLKTGQSIRWPDRSGKERALTIVEVRRD
jgi:regulator of nucleoside diphosphate kinase